MASFEFTQDEMNDIIYSAREATVRFKRARTLYREGHESYAMWDEDTLHHNIKKYTSLEESLRERYEVAFGEEW